MNDQDSVDRLRQAINPSEPLTFAAKDHDAVAARLHWWRTGHVGHWPGCPCGRCPHPVRDDDPKEGPS